MSFWSTLFGGNAPNPSGISSSQLQGLATSATQFNPYSVQASEALAPAQSYFTRALGGDQDSLQSLLGPQVNTVMGQYDAAAKAATALGPRGGGRNATLAAAPFEKASAYGTALAGARSGAAQGLTGVGSAEGTIAQGESAAQEQALSTLTGAQTKANESALGVFGALGQGLGKIFAPGLSKLFGG